MAIKEESAIWDFQGPPLPMARVMDSPASSPVSLSNVSHVHLYMTSNSFCFHYTKILLNFVQVLQRLAGAFVFIIYCTKFCLNIVQALQRLTGAFVFIIYKNLP
jgi:hypothetical protein